MVVISGGMPRSGSRWYYRVTYELLVAAGNPDAKELREKYGDLLPKGLTLLPPMQIQRLVKFRNVSEKGVSFPVKTHTAPTVSISYYLKKPGFKGTFTYRDPRDVIVSALERGREMHEKNVAERYFGIGPYKTFARIQTLRGAIAWMKFQQIPRCRRWLRCRNVLINRYEDLRLNTMQEITRLAEFLELSIEESSLQAVLDKYDYSKQAEKPDYYTAGGGKIVNKGVIGRYREVFDRKEQALLNRKLGKFILELGYDL